MAARIPDPERVGASNPPSDGATTQLRDTLHAPSAFAEPPPSARARPVLSAHDVGVCVLTRDATLFETFWRSGGAHCAFSTVRTWTELVAKVEAGECGVAVIDTAALDSPIARCVGDLDGYSDRLVTLVAAGRNEAEELIGYLSERKIHRLLIKPPAAGISRLLLESAVGRYLQLLGRPGAALDVTGTHFAPIVAKAPERSKHWTIAAALLIAVPTIGGLGWLAWPSSAPRVANEAALAAPAAHVAEPTNRFSQLIASAERAFGAGRLAEPAGDNALDYYLTILAAEPSHAFARQRLGVVEQALFTQAESALLAGSLDDASAALAHVRRSDPQSARLTFLEAQLVRAGGSSAASPTAASSRGSALSSTQSPVSPPAGSTPAASTGADALASAATPTELDSLLTIARARIARKQLIEPEGDGAVNYLERAAQIDPANPGVRAANAELVTELTAAARAALRTDDVETAARLLAPARRFGNGRAVTELAADVATARASSLLARVRERVQAGALFSPESDSAIGYLALLDGGAEESGAVTAAWSEFSQAAGAQIRAALAAEDWATADAGIAALERMGRDPADAALLRRELMVGRSQADYLAVAAPAGELELLTYTLPEYPAEARSRGTEGWVDLEVVVDKGGAPRDVTAVASEPPRRFEQAAIAAVWQYRYAPFVADGETYERRVRLRMRFALR